MKRVAKFTSTRVTPEKAILVAVGKKTRATGWNVESSLEELEALAKSAGVQVVGKIIQKLARPLHTFYVGTGKLEELQKLKETLDYTVVIFDDELSPRQQKNLEDELKTKVIDRTALILDIFAGRALTSEGKLQVELAQHQYLLPRLAGQWSHLERLGGGIGTRGPGESQLETDRRIITTKIRHLEDQLEAVRRHRTLYRSKRKKGSVPVVSLVGYTNSGKSTLLNALSKSSVLVEDRLFSTLDPVTRRVNIPDFGEILLTDTVGFVNKLPPSIVKAFRATLEELEEADVLLHVVDITHVNAAEQSQTVENILKDLSLEAKPRITILNKVDLAAKSMEDLSEITGQVKLPAEEIVSISALKGWGLDKLLDKIVDFLKRNNDFTQNQYQ